MKYPKIIRITLSALLILSISIAKGQVEYRVGLGLYEMTDIYADANLGHPHPFVYSHQILSSGFLERQNKRITHRITARYIKLSHSLINSDYQPYKTWSEYGAFKQSEWDIGYNFLFSFGKHKRFSSGLGLSFYQDKLRSQIYKHEYYDFKNKAVAPSLILEANFKFLKSWYASPSLNIMVPIYYSSYNSANSTYIYNSEPSWFKSTTLISPRISIKKTIFSRE